MTENPTTACNADVMAFMRSGQCSAEREARELAETHGYDTAALRRRFDQYAHGCFSKNWNAGAMRRQAYRALMIAVERQGGKNGA